MRAHCPKCTLHTCLPRPACTGMTACLCLRARVCMSISGCAGHQTKEQGARTHRAHMHAHTHARRHACTAQSARLFVSLSVLLCLLVFVCVRADTRHFQAVESHKQLDHTHGTTRHAMHAMRRSATACRSDRPLPVVGTHDRPNSACACSFCCMCCC